MDFSFTPGGESAIIFSTKAPTSWPLVTAGPEAASSGALEANILLFKSAPTTRFHAICCSSEPTGVLEEVRWVLAATGAVLEALVATGGVGEALAATGGVEEALAATGGVG